MHRVALGHLKAHLLLASPGGGPYRKAFIALP